MAQRFENPGDDWEVTVERPVDGKCPRVVAMIYESHDGQIHAQVSGHGGPLQATPEALKVLIGDAITRAAKVILMSRRSAN